jgi:hypothetical protein
VSRALLAYESLSPRTTIKVQVEGVHVVLTIGNRSVVLPYNTAIDLAVMLRGHGKIAKANAGDLSVRRIGFADLTDGVLEEMKAQKNRDGTAGFTLRS